MSAQSHVSDKLLDLAYGELGGTDAAEVERHLAGCETCSRELAGIQGVRRVMAPLRDEAAPEAGRDSLRAFADRAALRAGQTRGRGPKWAKGWLLAATGLAGIAALGAWFLVQPPTREETGLVAVAERDDPASVQKSPDAVAMRGADPTEQRSSAVPPAAHAAKERTPGEHVLPAAHENVVGSGVGAAGLEGPSPRWAAKGGIAVASGDEPGSRRIGGGAAAPPPPPVWASAPPMRGPREHFADSKASANSPVGADLATADAEPSQNARAEAAPARPARRSAMAPGTSPSPAMPRQPAPVVAQLEPSPPVATVPPGADLSPPSSSASGPAPFDRSRDSAPPRELELQGRIARARGPALEALLFELCQLHSPPAGASLVACRRLLSEFPSSAHADAASRSLQSAGVR